MVELTIYDECSGKAELIGMELEDRQVKKIKVRWVNYHDRQVGSGFLLRRPLRN